MITFQCFIQNRLLYVGYSPREIQVQSNVSKHTVADSGRVLDIILKDKVVLGATL